jgi:hypothetical protein
MPYLLRFLIFNTYPTNASGSASLKSASGLSAEWHQKQNLSPSFFSFAWFDVLRSVRLDLVLRSTILSWWTNPKFKFED